MTDPFKFLPRATRVSGRAHIPRPSEDALRSHKPKAMVVAQFDWCAVKQNGEVFDMWEWNVWKRKWVRLSNTGCGFGQLANAEASAKKRSDEIAAMLAANRTIPPAL